MSRLIGALAILAALASGQNRYRLPEWVIDEGGTKMTAQSGGNYIQHGSFHQTTIGLVTMPGVNYVAWVGYWHPRPLFSSHDVAALAIVEPGSVADTLQPVTPRGRVANYGTGTENFTVFFTMTGPGGMPVYSDSRPMVLGPGRDTMVTFTPFRFTVTGPYVARCSCYLDRDENRANDVVVKPFKVSYRPPWPLGWGEVEPMPAAPSGRGVKDGGWLSFMASSGLFYAAKGNKTGDFYSYDPLRDEWTQLPSIPKNEAGKLPAKGGQGVTDGVSRIYATTGNNTLSFWRYTVGDSWERCADVPLAPSNKKVKGGTDMVYVEKSGTGYVYLLKGYKTDFYRYNVVTDQWEELPSAPVGIKPKWDQGSWLVYDGEHTIFAHKAKYHELWAFDLNGDTWLTNPLSGMPFYSPTMHLNKKSKAGGSAAWWDSLIVALKGGNTQECWVRDMRGDSWFELETIPAYGSTGKKKRVNAGGDIAAFGAGVFYALKGNKCLELWRYVADAGIGAPAPERSGVMAEPVGSGPEELRFAVNPVSGRSAVIRYALARPGPVRVSLYDVTGSLVLRQTLAAGRRGTVVLDLSRVVSGVYLVRMETERSRLTQKLVIER